MADLVLATLARIGALSIVVMLAVLLTVLAYAAWPSIRAFGMSFLYTSQWRPNELTSPARDAAGKVVRAHRARGGVGLSFWQQSAQLSWAGC